MIAFLQLLFMLFLIILLILLIVFAVYQAAPNRIGYIPLPNRVVPLVIEALELNDGDTLYDLGSGDGKVLRAAVRANAVQAVGVEINPIVAAISKLKGSGLPNYRIFRASLYNQDLSEATKIFTYLWPSMMEQLEPKLEKEVKKGTRIVSCDFPLPKKKPHEVINIGSKRQLGQKLYIYIY